MSRSDDILRFVTITGQTVLQFYLLHHLVQVIRSYTYCSREDSGTESLNGTMIKNCSDAECQTSEQVICLKNHNKAVQTNNSDFCELCHSLIDNSFKTQSELFELVCEQFAAQQRICQFIPRSIDRIKKKKRSRVINRISRCFRKRRH
ncbi:hypothetical protein ACOME3_008109 [Neoechinorhynchus agilis]